jgi:CRP-like cAMP-binding protein
MDFTLVLGIDSSAGQAIAKLRDAMTKHFGIELSIFVTGSEQGFPTEFDLTRELCTGRCISRVDETNDIEAIITEKSPLWRPQISTHNKISHIPTSGSEVCETLDLALILAEDVLLLRQDPSLLREDDSTRELHASSERQLAIFYLKRLCPPNASQADVERLFEAFNRETYQAGEWIWRQGSRSDCAKLLLSGSLVAVLEDEAGTSEAVTAGNTIGELGLVEDLARMSSVRVESDAVLYSLSRNAWDQLDARHPSAARLVDKICVRYLCARTQLVSNRIFETRCLPI